MEQRLRWLRRAVGKRVQLFGMVLIVFQHITQKGETFFFRGRPASVILCIYVK